MSNVEPPLQGPFRIAAVARLTGVPAPTLRAWERRYGIPQPARTASAYRLYSAADVALVRAMRALCDKGVAAADAARTVRESPEAAAASASAQSSEQVDAYESSVDRMLSAIESYDSASLDAEVARALLLGNGQTLYERVVSPLLKRVGDRWHQGTLSVAQEHLASERLASLLRHYLRLVQPGPGARTALLACFADEDHLFGMLGAAMAFAAWGFRVEVMGARTPPFALKDAVMALNPAIIGLSVTVAPSPARARELAQAYAEASMGLPWVVGGGGVDAIADIVVAHGGHVARGDASEWQRLARSWMAKKTTATKPTKTKTKRRRT